MQLFSALDDFAARTLGAIPGWFRKLDYLAGLRTPQGRYTHWGMNRMHGDDDTQQAASEAHRRILSQLLQTPIQRLEAEADQASSAQGLSAEAYLEELSENGAVIPPQAGATAPRHLSSMLLALWSLAQAKRVANRRAS